MYGCYNFESSHKILWTDGHHTSETSLFQHFITWNLWNLLNFNCGFPGLAIATDTVANTTHIFSLATKNSGLVASLAIRFLYDLDLN